MHGEVAGVREKEGVHFLYRTNFFFGGSTFLKIQIWRAFLENKHQTLLVVRNEQSPSKVFGCTVK